ncbi:bifunctional 5,10-methylenetetrahydrofolate dehydrogenase/5,10-methenyltetrahydrofolate cyclohydrolase [Ktedonosporobacter rubrisoli]|uniref:Bifunctional protein FolD n=1 Tax=Ktedonosporobacter rubrisoli TaxID=2509675 RepID=A0A4P6JZU2_KTERU|nr:bifunctional 5,10-methylenetetrahydrofolate dehydrogenase/5,10-methenyltetrahydrofolate cyclohydrolase [Ktedonosporobacter rubrisoli]QBD80910.1 bifunctional 5,10-methylenetetrahydrofolate dehydrogenase/5,10-methenyltetrahydrofolate cyclohydrolase [Ktedonosporobacter rubrisoli]
MPAIIYDNKPLLKRLSEELRAEAVKFRQQHQRQARLAQVIVGHDAAAELYSRQLVRSCRNIGLGCATFSFPFETEEQELRKELEILNNDPGNDGVVLLLPLPAHIRQRAVTEVLRPEKDVDGLGPRNAGNLLLGFPNFIPSTADTILTVLQDTALPVAGRHAVIVGRSNIGGKPTALVLMRLDATVTVCHTYTQNLPELTREADILVVSVGRPGLITADMVKPGAVVLDAGINTVNGQVVGDVDFAGVKQVASFITPVPGGLGPLTHLTLIRHTLLGPQ